MARTANPHPEGKERLLSAAQKLMLKKGFAGTTVDEICEKAGLTKGSFFHYFENKEDLTKTALGRFGARQVAAMREATNHREPDPLRRIYALLDSIVGMAGDSSYPRSCLVGMITQELAETNPRLRSVCREQLSAIVEMFTGELEAAQRGPKPHSAIDAQGLAEHLAAIIQGSFILGKAKADRERITLQNNVRHFKAYVKHLFEE